MPGGRSGPVTGRIQIARAIRTAALVLALLGGAATFLWMVHDHYPIQRWLFWRYAGYWGACALFTVACVSVGHLVMRRIARGAIHLHEHYFLSFAIGVYAFELLVFLCGLAQLYSVPGLFFAIPLVLTAIGIRSLFTFTRRALRKFSGHRTRIAPLPGWAFAIIAFGFVGLLMVYFPIITPKNAQFDTTWKQMAIAEDYVVSGGIRVYPEGWTTATRPHFTSFLYTWGFLIPSGKLFDRIGLCGHLEFVIFLWTTLVGVPAMVRRLVPRADPRLVWAARFLFPGVFLYDSSLSIGSDHVGALFGPAIFLATHRVWRRLDPRAMVPLGIVLSAATLVKYTIIQMLVVAPILAIAGRTLWLGVQALRRKVPPDVRKNVLVTPAIATGLMLALTSPLWLRNVILHANPLYPILYESFQGRPWTEDATYLYKWGYEKHQFWRPTRDLDGLLETFKALFNFSFVPNNWKTFHGKVPVFGSLFTLSLLCLPFLKGTKRIWWLVGYVHFGVFAWYWIHHQDRYLQGMLPLMAACTAAIFVLVWRASHIAKVALTALIAFQVIWGGDVFFIRTHAMVKSPLKAVNDLLEAGYRKKYEQRLNVQERFVAIGKATPEGSRVLIHELHQSLGLNRERVSDWLTWQFGISYALLESPDEVDAKLREMGVTHLVWVPRRSRSWESIAGDIMFFSYAHRYGQNRRRVAGSFVAEMPSKPPGVDAASFQDKVVVLACRGRPYVNGLYRVRDLRLPSFGPDRKGPAQPLRKARKATEAKQWIAHASYVVLDIRCHKRLPGSHRGDFEHIVSRKRMKKNAAYHIYMRKSGTPAPIEGR